MCNYNFIYKCEDTSFIKTLIKMVHFISLFHNKTRYLCSTNYEKYIIVMLIEFIIGS